MKTILERLMEKVSPEPNSGCWIWTAACNADGYGEFHFSKGTNMRAHRASWTLHKGPIPNSLQVLHRCDVPACVNPDHLFLGTQVENIKDMVSKRRQRGVVGERHHKARMTEESVRRLRKRKAEGARIDDLVNEFGIKRSMVGYICNRSYWKHVE